MPVLLLTFLLSDVEGWLITESRFPLVTQDSVTLRMRIITDFRVSGRTHGLQQALFRGGVMLTLAPWVTLATQTSYNAQPTGQPDAGSQSFQQELRQELEANFYGRWGWGRFHTRHRAEFRFINWQFQYRHRILLRFAFALPSWRLWPVVYDEIMLDPIRDWINQNRIGASIEIAATPVIRVEVGYLLKSRSTGTAPNWRIENDHCIRLFLIYSADSFF